MPLGHEQPCLFGRMEARQKRLSYCLLTENDLARGDGYVRLRINEERDAWRRLALAGERHALLIMAVAQQIAYAPPGRELLQLAQHLCRLYCGLTETDKIHLDDLILAIHHPGATEYRTWRVGVNYFSAQGDGRWWRDHRIPGGMAFSMNSVGHMARTRAEESWRKNPELARRLADVPRERLVYWALPTAMRTIGPRGESSTRGTWLAERGTFPEDQEPPTYERRHRAFQELAHYSENRYLGLYHTDETIPSSYFDPTLTDPGSAKLRDDLYFTYLHRLTDADYETMGIGTDVGALDEERTTAHEQTRSEP